MSDIVLAVPKALEPPPSQAEPPSTEDTTSAHVTREWLVTNGVGGYASGTVSLTATRRYHGLLVAALPAPLGRTLMLAHLGEVLRFSSGEQTRLSPRPGAPPDADALPTAHLVEFRLEYGLPVWTYESSGVVVERRLWMAHRQNTIYVSYALRSSGRGRVELELEPWLGFRPHDGPLDAANPGPYALTVVGERYDVACDGFPPLRLRIDRPDAAFTIDRKRARDVRYRVERSRGYDSVGELHSPGYLRFALQSDDVATLVASTEPWEAVCAMSPAESASAERARRTRLLESADPAARDGFGTHLVLAADQFLIAPVVRSEDSARARATGDEVRTVIAGYHWFTDWGRDTMIALEGLTLVTGRADDARYILRTFADYVRDGLIPNLFPEHGRDGLYHTADASLWYFHAIDRYVEHTGDHGTLRLLLPKLVEIAEKHVAGTRFSIGVDPRDGLLSQGAAGYALTWMDAKVGDLVVTPRRGKAVEINALFFNAMRLLATWLDEEHGDGAGKRYREIADRTYASFNRRFWFADGGYLYDLVDGEGGDDASFRPNQVLALSLRHPVLEPSRWSRVLGEVRRRLLTPFGLRSLDAGDPQFKAKYFGDLRSRDLAYHQGTVWAWLIGPFVDACLRVDGDRQAAHALLEGFRDHLAEAGIGSISEIFDAEGPFVPRGCIAQAWSVAEVLRSLVKTANVAPR